MISWDDHTAYPGENQSRENTMVPVLEACSKMWGETLVTDVVKMQQEYGEVIEVIINQLSFQGKTVWVWWGSGKGKPTKYFDTSWGYCHWMGLGRL